MGKFTVDQFCKMETYFPRNVFWSESGIFSVCALHYLVHPEVTEHVPFHSKSSFKNMARACMVANIMHPLSGGGQTGTCV